MILNHLTIIIYLNLKTYNEILNKNNQIFVSIKDFIKKSYYIYYLKIVNNFLVIIIIIY